MERLVVRIGNIATYHWFSGIDVASFLVAHINLEYLSLTLLIL